MNRLTEHMTNGRTPEPPCEHCGEHHAKPERMEIRISHADVVAMLREQRPDVMIVNRGKLRVFSYVLLVSGMLVGMLIEKVLR